jgi:hypothetical protein
VIGALHSRHRAIEFKKFLQTIDRKRPPTRRPSHPGQQLDAQNAGNPQLAGRAPPVRLALHPHQSSWLNLVERWFAELTTKKLRRGARRSVRQLNADRAWIDIWNQDPNPFVWTKTADQILDSIARSCKRINESRH